MHCLTCFCGALLASLALLSSGCATALRTPEGFVELPASNGEYRAVSADGATLRLRILEEPLGGDAAFWNEALRHEFIENRGYTLIEHRVTASGEETGHEYLFETTLGGRPHRYLVALFCDTGRHSSRFRVIEYLAPRATFDRYLDRVRSAVARQ